MNGIICPVLDRPRSFLRGSTEIVGAVHVEVRSGVVGVEDHAVVEHGSVAFPHRLHWIEELGKLVMYQSDLILSTLSPDAGRRGVTHGNSCPAPLMPSHENDLIARAVVELYDRDARRCLSERCDEEAIPSVDHLVVLRGMSAGSNCAGQAPENIRWRRWGGGDDLS